MGGKSFDYANQQVADMTTGTSIRCGGDGEFFVCGIQVNALYGLLVNSHYIGGATNLFNGVATDPSPLFKVKSGDVISHDGALNNAGKKIVFLPYL